MADNNTCVDIDDMSRWSDVLMGIYIVVFIFGLVFNLIIFAPIIQQIRRKNVLGIYLLNLSISDLLYIVTMPLWIHYYNQNHHWELPTWSCRLAGFFYYSNMYISIYLLCCISVDRCLTITYPFQAKVMRRLRYAWGSCAAVFIFISSLHGGVLALDEDDVYDNKTRQCYETYPLNNQIATFNLVRVVLFFTVPFVVLVVCYMRIWAEVRVSTGLDERGKRKVKRLAVAVISIFCVCFFPYHLLLAVRSVAFFVMKEKSNCDFEGKLHFGFAITLALTSFNCVVDPLLYMLASNGVREDMQVCYRYRKVVQSQPITNTAMTKL